VIEYWPAHFICWHVGTGNNANNAYRVVSFSILIEKTTLSLWDLASRSSFMCADDRVVAMRVCCIYMFDMFCTPKFYCICFCDSLHKLMLCMHLAIVVMS
jgi:hypothetical protein